MIAAACANLQNALGSRKVQRGGHGGDNVRLRDCLAFADGEWGVFVGTLAKFPLVIERYALVPDSGGAGRHRGGLGVERVVRARSHVTVNTQIDRAHCRPWGLAEGGDGKGNSVALRIDGAWKTDFPNAKVLVAQVKAGDAFRLRSGGGGGYGSPLTRPVEDVRNDVRQGYVSVEEAATLYGVIVDPVTFVVDEEATARRRAALAAPPGPAAASA